MLKSNKTIDFRGIELNVEYSYSKYIPAILYLDNGDPGYPDEGGELYINKVLHCNEDITLLFEETQLDEITNILLPYVNF